MESRIKNRIADLSELIRAFEGQVQDIDLSPLSLRVIDYSGGVPSAIRVQLEGDYRDFRAYFILNPTSDGLREIATANRGSRLPPLIVAPRFTNRMVDAAREVGVNILDLNGTVFLRTAGSFVFLRGDGGRRFRYDREPGEIFAGKSVRVVRALLSDWDADWVQSELVRRTGVSAGLVSRITKHLRREGHLEAVGSRVFRVKEPRALLEEWAEADDFEKRCRTRRFSVFDTDAGELAGRLHELVAPQVEEFAFTQWIAAWYRFPHTTPPVISAYVSRPPDEETLMELGARPVASGGNIWLHVPLEEGVFLENRIRDGFRLVSDAQIYVDVVKQGLRGPEQAKALAGWEGFCRR